MALKKNLVFQFAQQAVAILLPLVTAPYVSRVLLAEGVGEYSYAYTVAFYFYIVSYLGFDTHGQRLVAQARDNREARSRIFSEIVTLQVSLLLVTGVVYGVYVLSLDQPARLIPALQFFYIASASIDVLWLFEGLEDFKTIALRNIAVQVASCVLIFLLVRRQSDLWIYTAIMAGSVFAGNLLYFIPARKYVDYHFPKFREMIAHLKPSLILFVPQISMTIFMKMDKLMLGWWSTSRQLGYYQNAETTVNIPMLAIIAVGTVLMPRIIALRADRKIGEIKRFNQVSFDLLMTLAVGCTFGLTAVAPVFTPWYFGEDFRESAGIVSILSAQIMFFTFENVMQKQYLIPFERDGVVIRALSAGAVANTVLNALLIPRFGSSGAISGSLVSHLLVCCWEGIYLRKELPIRRYLLFTLALLAAGAGMCAAVRAIGSLLPAGSPFLALVIMILSGVVIYLAGAYLVLRLFRSDTPSFLLGELKIKSRKK